jgi:segregation and condensation protein A
MSDDYRVKLDIFSGPLDLLLYLIKREELDIHDVALVQVTDQYLQYVKLIEKLDPNAVGDFLVVAATLTELKSRALLPAAPPEVFGDDDDDLQTSLVKELLEYKRFKDAARRLGSAADERSKRYVRAPAELPKELAGVELEEVQVWDLVATFNKVMAAIGAGPKLHEVDFDDTPIEAWADELELTLRSEGVKKFHELFKGRRTRQEIVGLFLAMLEMMRNRRLRIEQEKNFGAIYLFLLVEETDDADAEADAEADLDRDVAAADRLPDVSSAEPSAPDDGGPHLPRVIPLDE